jgi:hypothetical protein
MGVVFEHIADPTVYGETLHSKESPMTIYGIRLDRDKALKSKRFRQQGLSILDSFSHEFGHVLSLFPEWDEDVSMPHVITRYAGYVPMEAFAEMAGRTTSLHTHGLTLGKKPGQLLNIKGIQSMIQRTSLSSQDLLTARKDIDDPIYRIFAKSALGFKLRYMSQENITKALVQARFVIAYRVAPSMFAHEYVNRHGEFSEFVQRLNEEPRSDHTGKFLKERFGV